MRYMAGPVFFALMLSLAPAAFGAEPLSGHSLKGFTGMTGVEGNRELQEYLLEGKQTVEGVIAAMTTASTGSGLMTITTQSGAVPFVFDNDTKFRIGLRPAELEDVKPGLKIAGLYVENAGSKRLVRVMVLKDLPPLRHRHGKHSRKKKSHRKMKRHR